MKRLISVFLSFSLILFSTIPVFAEDDEYITVSSESDISDVNVPLEEIDTSAAIGQTLDIKAKSVILIEPFTGKTLYENNPDEKIAPASITKIMSLLLIMEAIQRGDLTLKTKISASEHACSMGGSQIWLEPNETMTVDDLLKATVIASANDATVALGEAIAGSEEGFVAMMNERAKELGMVNTTFINATGLDADGHLSTARDVGIMSCELIKHELIKKYTTVWMDTLRDGKSELVNTNKLVRFYEGTTGLKTGTTSTAGYCLSATANRSGMELVAVVMGGVTSNDRFNGAKKLLDYGFANYSFSKITGEIDKNMTVPVIKGVEKTVKVIEGEPLNLLLQKTESGNITKKIILNKKVTAPVKSGDEVGVVKIMVNDKEVGEIKLIIAQDVNKISFLEIARWMLKGLFSL